MGNIMFRGLLACLMTATVLNAHALIVDQNSYQYPTKNPFAATVIGTAPKDQPVLPADEDIDQSDYSLEIIPSREESIPNAFWPSRKLTYRLAQQDHNAPLIFLIAGTGANYASDKNEYLKKLMYQAGYHVVQISSPTSYDFLGSASTTATPGFTPNDAKDLYRVMTQIKSKHKDLPVSEYHLTGYSLGALDSAYLSQMDESKKEFNFKKVLLINPPVNLETSVKHLQKLVHVQIQALKDNPNLTFYDVLFDQMTDYFRQEGTVKLNPTVLYSLQKSPEKLTTNELAMLIGTVFRLTSADMAFMSDLINQRGHIVPKGTDISIGTSLEPFYHKSLQCNFDCYVNQQLLPMLNNQGDERLTADIPELYRQASLTGIQDYLAQSTKIGVMHNIDDPIIDRDDVNFLINTFGDRLTLFPSGGHCGNMNYRDNAKSILEFFRE